MPRGRKKKADSLASQLQLIDQQIEQHKQTLEALRKEKKETIELKYQQELKQISQYLKETGKSATELVEMIESKK